MAKYKEERVKFPKKSKDVPLSEKPNKHVQDLYLAASKDLKREQDYHKRAEESHRRWESMRLERIMVLRTECRDLLAELGRRGIKC